MTGSITRRTFGGRLAAGSALAAAMGLRLPMTTSAAVAAQMAKALSGAGATFPQVLYSKWADVYNRATGVQINYQGIGSGGGIKQFTENTVDFGASDAPMSDEQIKAAEANGGPVLHIPTTLGAVVPTYNIPSLQGGKPLVFGPDTLPGIFLGTITRWNDPKIAALNPGVSLPDQPITTVHRSDGSGTNYVFTSYLSAVSPEFKQKVGADTTVSWPNGLGGKGNPGVAGEVKQTPYSIGYVELVYAMQEKLGVGSMVNKAGKQVQPTLASVTAAAAGSLNDIPNDLRFSIINSAGETAWPISTGTWILARRQQTDAAKGRTLADFLFWGITEGQKFCADLFYAPLPDAILPIAYGHIAELNYGGVPLLGADRTLAPKRTEVNTVDNGDGTATTSYSDGTQETWKIGG